MAPLRENDTIDKLRLAFKERNSGGVSWKKLPAEWIMALSTQPCERPFPRPCVECGNVEVRPATISYDAEIKHDGRLWKFTIPALKVNRCTVCGEVYFDNITDDQISLGLREHLNLLSPQQIRDGLKTLGLMQKEFGRRIGVAPETISRWLSGTHIQSRAMDNLMRLFFELDSVRSKLTLEHAWPVEKMVDDLAAH